jgi:uncharacterized protein YqgC (DUF456 family)
MEHPYSDYDRSTATHTLRRNYHTRVRPPQAIASPGTGSIETDVALLMDLLMYGIAAALIALGLAGSVVPLLPGIPLIFGGIWLIAGTDHYRHLGLWWLLAIALVGTVGLLLDLLAGALGSRRMGASRQAIWGALLGTLVGVFFGLPGLFLGPFLGALLGELATGNSVLRSTHAGVGAWIGVIFGTIIKLVASLTMVSLLGAAWWWNHRP